MGRFDPDFNHRPTLRVAYGRASPPSHYHSGVLRRLCRLASVAVVLVLSASFLSLVPPLLTTGAPPSWTVMVYLDADNDLEDHGIDDFLEMSSVGSTASLNILVQFDRFGGMYGIEDDTRYGDWTDCLRFRITKGMTPTEQNSSMDLGEVDMAGAGVLADFIDWAVGNYTASNYMLVIWDHGADWYGTCWDYTDGFDYMSLGFLNGEIGLASGHQNNLVFDILAFDACSMGAIEVAYELSWCANYMLASEAYVPDDGFNYTSLQALVDDPRTSGPELGARFVQDYATYYYSLVGTPHEFMLNESFTLSVLDLSMIDSLTTAVDDLSVALLPDAWDLWENITEARQNTQAYDAVNWDDGGDLYDLMINLDNCLPVNNSLRVLITSVMDLLNATVISETHGTNPLNCTVPVDRAHGLTIYYPSNEGYLDPMYSPATSGYLRFVDDFYWDDFLGSVWYGWPWVTNWGPVGIDVATTAVIEIWFSEPVDHISAEEAFRLTPTVSGTFYWVDVEYKMVFVPDVELAPGTTYNVTILGGYVRDYNGLTMIYTHTWEFKTAGEPIPEFGAMPLAAIVVMLMVAVAIESRRRKPST